MAKDFKKSLTDYLTKVYETIQSEYGDSSLFGTFKSKFVDIQSILNTQIEQIKTITQAVYDKISESLDTETDTIKKDVESITEMLLTVKSNFTDWCVNTYLPVLDDLMTEDMEKEMKKLQKSKKRSNEDEVRLASLQTAYKEKEMYKTVFENCSYKLFFNGLDASNKPASGSEVFVFGYCKVDEKVYEKLVSFGNSDLAISSRQVIEQIKTDYQELYENVCAEIKVENASSIFDDDGNLILDSFFSKDYKWCDISSDKADFEPSKERVLIPYDYITDQVKVELDSKTEGEAVTTEIKSIKVEDREIKLDDLKEGLSVLDLSYGNAKYSFSFIDLVKFYLYLYRMCYKEKNRINSNINIFNKFVLNTSNEKSIASQLANVEYVYVDELNDELEQGSSENAEKNVEDYIKGRWTEIFNNFLDAQESIKNELSSDDQKKEFSEFLLNAVLTIRTEKDLLSSYSKLSTVDFEPDTDLFSKSGTNYIITIKDYLKPFKIKNNYVTKDTLFVKKLTDEIDELNDKNNMFYIENIQNGIENKVWKKDFSLIVKTDSNDKFGYYLKNYKFDDGLDSYSEDETFTSNKSSIKDNYEKFITYSFTEHEEDGIVFDYSSFTASQIKFDLSSALSSISDYLNNLASSVSSAVSDATSTMSDVASGNYDISSVLHDSSAVADTSSAVSDITSATSSLDVNIKL